MEAFVEIVGVFFVTIGGIAAVLAALCFFWWLADIAWIAASNRFRDICKTESLIHEYRRNREKFLEWLAKGNEK